ncbi:MAG: T9SS type A sorting domain-containing protein [Candidatus Electryonea clarkiae]|nr:T9SS type A sorting domain-containing protein [Candidatus Electryonea clarkiae]MDP8289333.1 T9SS type A sorting domain-containing protein [Candidatus Electryonea clarkiae]
MKKKHFLTMITCLAMVLFVFNGITLAQVTNKITNGDLETVAPFWWTTGAAGGTMTWANDQASDGMMSLKIEKDATGTAASWVSGNQAQTYWNHMEAVLYTVSFNAKTMGANTEPSTDDERIGAYFYFEAEGESIGEVFVAADQTAGDVDWTEYTGEILLADVPDNAWIELVMGSGATGTVWFDQMNYASDPWTSGCFGWSAENPIGWMSWSAGGDAGFAAVVEDENAHSGTHVAKLMETDDEGDEMVFYTAPHQATGGSDYLVSVWIKTETSNTDINYYPTGVIGENISDRFNLCFFFHSGDIAHDWAVTGGDRFLYANQMEAVEGWVQYKTIVTAPEDATGFSMRARFNPTVTGTVYFDDFSFELVTGDNLVENCDLETRDPYWWGTGAEGGTLTWADDDASDGEMSLKIEKDATGTAASWVSDNQAQTFWNHMEAVLYTCSFYAKTSGANTEPANNDAEIGAWFYFEADGESIGEVFVAADQTAGDVDWTQYTGEILLADVPDNAWIELVMGSDATGTVWFDQMNYASDPWTSGCFGWSAENPVGWMSWSAGAGAGYAAVVADENAHSGDYSVLLEEADEEGDEMVFYSVPVAAMAGELYEFSVWIRTVSISPTDAGYFPSAVLGENISERANLCFFFHAGDIEHEWSTTGGDQFIYVQQINAEEGWMQYRAIVEAPEDATGASLRARFNPTVQGEIYFDDFMIRELTIHENAVGENLNRYEVAIPRTLMLDQNYPNPFNSATSIRYGLPTTGNVNLTVFDILGRQVVTLVDGIQVAGHHTVSFDLTNSTNLGSGFYFYRINTQDQSAVRKMIYLK